MTWRPVLVLLLLAPYLGEVLSTATSPLQLLLPGKLALLVGLYGSGALLCRELARRWGLGLPGLALLGAAYGVYEEALVDRFWFDPGYAAETGIGAYSEIWHTNVLVAVDLTAFHSAVSICSSVLIVECLFPGRRDRAWVRPWSLVVPAVAMLVVAFLTYAEYVPPRPPQIAVAVGIGVLFVLAALRSRRRPGRVAEPSRRPRPRLLAVVAFVATAAHFVLTYTVRSTGLPWPVGVAVAAAPLVIGVLLVRRFATTVAYGRDGLSVVTGILGFFVLHDVFVGIAGRYDLIGGGLLVAAGLIRLHRRFPAHAQREP